MVSDAAALSLKMTVLWIDGLTRGNDVWAHSRERDRCIARLRGAVDERHNAVVADAVAVLGRSIYETCLLAGLRNLPTRMLAGCGCCIR